MWYRIWHAMAIKPFLLYLKCVPSRGVLCTVGLGYGYRVLIDWLLGLNVRAAVSQLYSGDEHETDDKMNMKNGMGHKDNRVDQFWLPLEQREGWVRSGNLASCGQVQRFLLLSNTTAGFFNMWGTWQWISGMWFGLGVWYRVSVVSLWV